MKHIIVSVMVFILISLNQLKADNLGQVEYMSVECLAALDITEQAMIDYVLYDKSLDYVSQAQLLVDKLCKQTNPI